MAEKDLSAAIAAAKRMAFVHFDLDLDESAIAVVIEDVWWGSREVYAAFQMGLITRSEAAIVVVAHIETRLISDVRNTRSVTDWEPITQELVAGTRVDLGMSEVIRRRYIRGRSADRSATRPLSIK